MSLKQRHRTSEEIRLENEVKKSKGQIDELQAKLEYVAIMADVDIDTETENGGENV